MAVVIRLTRVGTNKKPRYRIVATDSRFPIKGRKLENIGSYNPFNKEKGLIVNTEKVSYWVKNGAKLSNTLQFSGPTPL